MTYALIKDGLVAAYPYSEHQLREDHRSTSFPSDLSEADLTDFGVVTVIKVPPPSPHAEEEAPQLVDGVWTQVWKDLPAPVRVPESVTMAQARIALFMAGKLSLVDDAIASLPSPHKELAQIEWEFRPSVSRGSQLVASLGTALGLDDAAIDELFIAAASVP